MQKGIPVTPASVLEMKKFPIPSFVIDCFNELISKRYYNGQSLVYQSDVLELIRQKTPADQTYDARWLNIEPLFEESGWTVTYCKPGYNESYPPSFKFVANKLKQ